MTVDLDIEQNRKNSRGDNKFFFVMKSTGKVRLSVLDAYLKGKCGWDNSILECMSK